jgi:class 3 adenylate cyclase
VDLCLPKPQVGVSCDLRHSRAVRDLPSGTVTFLLSDVEGSTGLVREFGDQYPQVLAEHRRVMRLAFARHGGVEVDTQGDAFFAAFGDANGAVAAAAEVQSALAEGPVLVRMGNATRGERRSRLPTRLPRLGLDC